MPVPDLARMLREADHDQLAAAVRAAVDAAGYYSPAPRADYGDTDQSIACAEAKAEAAQEVVDAIVLALTAHPGRPASGQAPAADGTDS